MKPLLIHGDCLEAMATLDAGSIDMVMTDPPYGTTACKWDSIIPLDEMWAALKRITKPNAAIVLMASQPFTTILIGSNIKSFRYCWYWNKPTVTGFASAKIQPLRCVEDVVVFYTPPGIYYPQGIRRIDKTQVNGRSVGGGTLRGDACGDGLLRTEGSVYTQEFTGYPKQVLNIDSATGGIHPTQKPVALMEYLIKTYTTKGDTVLDFTMGSGTTGVAAKRLDRAFVGIERDDEYFAIAKNRIETAEIQEELFEAEQPEPETQLELNGPEPERKKNDSR